LAENRGLEKDSFKITFLGTLIYGLRKNDFWLLQEIGNWKLGTS
jgi:hypothetical protein